MRIYFERGTILGFKYMNMYAQVQVVEKKIVRKIEEVNLSKVSPFRKCQYLLSKGSIKYYDKCFDDSSGDNKTDFL